MTQVVGTSPLLEAASSSAEKGVPARPAGRPVGRQGKIAWRRSLRRLRGLASLAFGLAVAMGILAVAIWQLAELLS